MTSLPNQGVLHQVAEDESFSQSHCQSQSAMELKVDKVKELTKQENKAVHLLRYTVFGLLLTITALVSTGVYVFSSRTEQKDFEDGFEVHANQLVQSFQSTIELKLIAVGTLANSMTSYALATGQEFPFVTLPDFSARASDVRNLADALSIHWCPLVTDDNRDKWEKYALENRFQIDEAFNQDLYFRQAQDAYFQEMIDEGNARRLQNQQQQGEGQMVPNELQDGTGYRLRIFNTATDQVEPNGTGPFLPSWQRSPVNAQKQSGLNANWNTAKILQGLDIANNMSRDKKVLLGRLVQVLPQVRPRVEANIKISQYRQRMQEYLDEPQTSMVYPVFHNLNHTSREVAGILSLMLYWRAYFQDTLPSDAQGIIAVIHNSYNQTNSYRIDGLKATLLGEGDFHDPAFDDMVVSLDVSAAAKEKASPETMAYLTVPLHDTMGQYILKVYPTSDTKNTYTSNKPMIYTVVVALIFLVTGGAFLLFDTYVERRQEIVKKRAMEAGAIVDSLFPEQVQNRMFQEEQASTKPQKEQSWYSEPNTDRSGLLGVEQLPESASLNKNHIADLYPEATVIFSDLAGFTKWSSTRTPSEVFELLETIYSEMDAAALRRKVFKVETIGDCWLGVCGLPNPNARHAVVCAKFAYDCQKKVQEILISKVDSLGEGTESLNLRTGLHSGPVTAGVLRGQKSRFQLFGDTVNTASRMESLGQPGRIHVSQAAAEAIIAEGGKKEWLIAREDKVFAKGKGDMQTYWFSPGYDTRTVVTTSGESISGDELVSPTPTSMPQDTEHGTVPTDDWI